MKVDYQFCEQDDKLNVYVRNHRQEESLLLLKSKRVGENKMSIVGATQKDRLNQTRLGKERSSLTQDFQKNSVSRVRLLSSDQLQTNKQPSSLPSSSSSLRNVPQNLSLSKSTAERAKSDNTSDIQNKVGSLSSSPKWSRIKDKFEKGGTSLLLESIESSSKALSNSSNVSIRKGTLQKKSLENKIMPLQSRSVNVNVPSAKLKCSSLPYKFMNGNDRLQERTKRSLALRSHTRYTSLENNSTKLALLGNSSIQPTQSVLSKPNKPTVNSCEEAIKQKAKIPVRSIDYKKNENSDCLAAKKVSQDAKTRTIDCHPIPASRTSLNKPKTLQIYSNVSLHSTNIGRPLQYKGKLTKERPTCNENEILTKREEEKKVGSKLKLQKSTDTLPYQRTRTVSDSGQATNLRLFDCEVTESKVAYLTNKFNFLSCQNLEMKKSCSAVSVDEANKYILSKSFSASNVFSTVLHKNESCCKKSSQKQTSLACSEEIFSECLPPNSTSCAVMEKCSCLGLFSKQTDQCAKKSGNDHICRIDSEICTQPLSNKTIQLQDFTPTENEKLSVVQKAVLNYEENLVLLSPETQRKAYLLKLKDSPVSANSSEFNDIATEKIEINVSTTNRNHYSASEKITLRDNNTKIKRVASNKETTRIHSYDSQKLSADKSVEETSVVTKMLEGNKQEKAPYMLSKSSRSLTLDSIRCSSSFLHNLTSNKECATVDTKPVKSQVDERQYANQSELKMQPSLKPNSSFLWASSTAAYQKSSLLAQDHHYENCATILGKKTTGQNGQKMSHKQSNSSISCGNNGSCDSDDQGSWIDVSDPEADNAEKCSSDSVAISTLRRNKGRKDTQKRNSLRRSWSDSLRATTNVTDCNDDEYQDVSAWEAIDGENSSGSTEMENQYESLYESIYQNINFDDKSNSSHSPDGSNKHNSDTSSEIFDNDDDMLSLNSEKTSSSLDDKKKPVKRQWSLSRSDIKIELASKLNKIMSSKKNSQSTTEIGPPKMREKNTETKKNTLMRYFRGQKSNTAGPLLGSSIPKRELSTFYINETDIKSENALHCNKSDSFLHSGNSTGTDENIHPALTVDHFKKPQNEKTVKPVLRRHVQRPTAPPPLPPGGGDPIAKCRGGTKSMEFIRSQAVTFNKTRSLDSTYYNALSEGNVLYSEITIQEGSLPNKNSVGEISSISTSEEMITSSSSSDRTISENSSLSSCSKGSRYSENCYSVASSITDSSTDRDRHSVFSCNSFKEKPSNSRFYQMEDNTMGGNNTLDYSNKHQNKTEILKSPFEEEPLYQFYLKDVRTRATLWQRMKSDDEQSETESVYVNVSEELTNGPLVLKSQLSAMELIKDEMGQRTLWCHVPEVKKSGILATLSSQDRNFQEAMFEVITSEASYLKSLNILIEHFIQCPEFTDEFSPRCVLNRRERHVLFSDVLPVKEVSESFLAELEAHWKENIMLSRVCEILHIHAANNFSVYVRYCSNQIYQDRTLKELKETKPEFTEVLNRLESSTVCQCLDMHSFLMLPMQRITRLPLLVDAIFHRLSSESPQYETCKATLALLNKVVQDCNEGARKMERMEEMLSIERQLDFKDCKGIPLISTSRWLVKKGELTRFICDTSSKRTISFSARWSKVPVYLFLFTDYLMVTKKKSEENFTVLDYCPRNMVQVAVLEDDNQRLPFRLPSNGRNFFQLTMLNNHRNKTVELILSVSLESERTRWMDAVTPPVSENPDERIYEVWDCPQVQCIYSYIAQQPDELTLEESDVVNVFRKMSDGWYEGERIRDGVRGWFPASYTEEIVSSHVRARNLRQHYRLLISLEKTKTSQGK